MEIKKEAKTYRSDLDVGNSVLSFSVDRSTVDPGSVQENRFGGT